MTGQVGGPLYGEHRGKSCSAAALKSYRPPAYPCSWPLADTCPDQLPQLMSAACRPCLPRPRFDAGVPDKAAVQREVIELKVRRQGKGSPLREALNQLDKYLDQLSLDTGYLVIFDRRDSALRRRPNPAITATSSPAATTSPC